MVVAWTGSCGPEPAAIPSQRSVSWTTPAAPCRIREGAMVIEHTIHIEASPETVWKVTVDVERWPQWSPTVISVQPVGGGPLRLGGEVRIRQPLQPAATWVVVALEERSRFTWETRRRGLRMIASHHIAPGGSGTTNVLRLEATGPIAVLLHPLLSLVFRRALAAENRGLRNRCEDADRSGGS
jgi:uncharacterized protein YndB with AHSA1/START domain